MKRRVRDRIESLNARGERAVVVPGRDGAPSRVFALRKYEKVQNVAKQVRPHEYRRSRRTAPDPLGAAEGTVKGRVRRREMYG